MKTFVPTISNWMRQRSSQSSPMAIISCGGGSAHNRATYLIANPSPSLKSVESSWEVGRDLTIVTFVRANANVPNLEVTILLHLIHYIVNLCTATLNSVEVAVTTSMSSMSQSFDAKCGNAVDWHGLPTDWMDLRSTDLVQLMICNLKSVKPIKIPPSHHTWHWSDIKLWCGCWHQCNKNKRSRFEIANNFQNIKLPEACCPCFKRPL